MTLGASDVFAAALAGSVGVMSIPGRFGLSAVSDYLNRRYVMAVSLFLMSIAIVFMARADSVTQVIPFLVLYSAAQGWNIGHTTITDRRILRSQGIRHNSRLPQHDSDGRHHHRPLDFGVCLRHHRQLRMGIHGVWRSDTGITWTCADDEDSGTSSSAHSGAP